MAAVELPETYLTQHGTVLRLRRLLHKYPGFPLLLKTLRHKMNEDATTEYKFTGAAIPSYLWSINK
jgi:hypothetical protein